MEHILKPILVEIRPSSMILGEVGLFAARDIQKGEVVCDFSESGEDFLTNEEFGNLSSELQQKVIGFTFGTQDGYLIDKGLDFNTMPTSHYANHSCDGNIGFDGDGNFIALRDIKRGEEITYDYALVDSNPRLRMECLCESASCRGLVTGDDWKDSGFQEKHRAHFHPKLRALIV